MRAKVKKDEAARILPCAACRGVCVRSLFPGTLGALYLQWAALVAAPGARGPPPGERGRSARHPPRTEGETTPGGGRAGGPGPRETEAHRKAAREGPRRSDPPAPARLRHGPKKLRQM